MFQDMFIGAYCNLSEIWAAVGLPPQTPWLRGGRGGKRQFRDAFRHCLSPHPVHHTPACEHTGAMIVRRLCSHVWWVGRQKPVMYGSELSD